MEGTFFYGDYLRWNLGWENPNPAGAFVATGIPLLWALGRLLARSEQKFSWGSWVFLILELGLWFLLCKTYSRGALVAAGVAALIYFLWDRVMGRRKGFWGLDGARILAVGILLFATGFLGRIEPEYVASDASAGNRLTLWKGGLQMISVQPWFGWGVDESGQGYMHWFQPYEDEEAYAGMVNSYLHVGVERGLIVLGGVLVVFCILVFCAFFGLWEKRKETTRWEVIMNGAGASLLVFLGANFFSTLWIFPNLWWVPLACVLLILSGVIWMKRKRSPQFFGKVFGYSFGVVVVSMLVLYGSARSLSNDHEMRRDDKLVYLKSSELAGEATKRILILPEGSCLGENWGKEVRRFLEDEAFDNCEVVSASDDSLPLPSDVEVVIVCGLRHKEARFLKGLDSSCHVIIAHPRGRPDELRELGVRRVSVLLPFIDTDRTGREWKKVAKRSGWDVATNPGVGQDMRLVWPQCLKQFFDREQDSIR